MTLDLPPGSHDSPEVFWPPPTRSPAQRFFSTSLHIIHVPFGHFTTASPFTLLRVFLCRDLTRPVGTSTICLTKPPLPACFLNRSNSTLQNRATNESSHNSQLH